MLKLSNQCNSQNILHGIYISGTPGTQCGVFGPLLCPWDHFKDVTCDNGCVVDCQDPPSIINCIIVFE